MDNQIFGHAATQTAMFLGLITLIIATAAWLLGRMISASTARRLVWQVALLCVGTLSMLELTGMSSALSTWAQTPGALLEQPADITAQDNFSDAEESRGDGNATPTDFAPELEIPATEPESVTPIAPAFVGPLPLDVASAQPDLAPYPSSDLLTDTWPGDPIDQETADLYAAELLADADSSMVDTTQPVAFVDSSASEPASASGLASVLGLLWIIGAAILIARALLGRALLCRFAAKLDNVENTKITQAALDVAANLHCRRAPRLKYAGSLAGPLAFGILRPTLVLPRNFSRQFTPEGQRAVLVHEIAHLRQADPFWLLVADLICALLWWNPAVWMMRSRFRLESELAADEATTCLDDGPAHLASSLLRLGTRLARPRAVGFVSADGLGFRSHLARRIERLVNLDENTCRPRRTRPFLRTLATVCIIAGCLIGTAWARPRLPSGGENNVSSINKSWRTSFAGAALAALLVGSPAAAEAQDAGPPKPDQAHEVDLAAIEAEIADLLSANAALNDQAVQEQADAEQAFAVQLADMETAITALRSQISANEAEADQLRSRGEQAAADQAMARLSELRAELAQRTQQIAEVRAEFRNRLAQRDSQERSRLRERMSTLERRLATARAADADNNEIKRMEDSLAMLRRSAAQGAARRRAETPPENADAAQGARRRAAQDRPRARDRAPEDPSQDEKIRLILQAADNLDRAGLKEQADELREAVRSRMGPPGVGPAGSTPPRARVPRPDSPARGRRAPADPGEPGQTPPTARRAPSSPREAGPDRPRAGAPPTDPRPARRPGIAPPGPDGPPEPGSDAPAARRRRAGPSDPIEEARAGSPNADRELLMLIRALQAEVNSLRSEVQTLRQDMNRDDNRDGATNPRVRRRSGDGEGSADEPENRRRRQELAASGLADDLGTTDRSDATADQGDATDDSGSADNGDASDSKDVTDAAKDSGDSPPNPGTTDRRRQ